jgi:CRISPR-associated protein Csd1
MILQALTRYYETMLTQGKISPPGWDDAFHVSFGLELAPDGTLLQLIPFKTEQLRGKKAVLLPRAMHVPAHAKRTVGITANFLCDNAAYMLGADEKGKPERAQECFAANAALHRTLLAGVDSDAARAVLAFFDTWQPAVAASHPQLCESWKEITAGANLIFCFGMHPLSEDPAIAAAWQRHYDAGDAEAVTGQCLVTGKTGPLAVLHPSIKGVRGAQTMGAALVSFNAPAFESYGHQQGMNAPVSEHAAFAYATALNYLLADNEHCRAIGDTTVVCWAEHGADAYQTLGMSALFGAAPGVEEGELRSALEALANGRAADWSSVTLNPDEHFYFLGLAPNAARLSVRFFVLDSFGKFMENVAQHYRDIAIVRPAYDNTENLSLWQLLNETVNQNARTKVASPQLAGDMLKAILTNTRYPATLLNGASLRIRAEKQITRGRAAILKAYYLRASHEHVPKEVLQMELNENCTDTAYTLGRLFSVYEQIQQAANPGINTTIKDKYFNSACGTPATIFPLLGNLAAKHLRVLRRDRTGAAVNLEKKLGELSVIVGKSYPTRLDLPSQGSFQLGYYFENQKRYEKKETVKEVTNHV